MISCCETKAMPKIFRRGDHVEWNSEAGRVRGVIIKKVVSDIRIKGYVHHASREEPQYLIQSDKTDHCGDPQREGIETLSGYSEEEIQERKNEGIARRRRDSAGF